MLVYFVFRISDQIWTRQAGFLMWFARHNLRSRNSWQLHYYLIKMILQTLEKKEVKLDTALYLCKYWSIVDLSWNGRRKGTILGFKVGLSSILRVRFGTRNGEMEFIRYRYARKREPYGMFEPGIINKLKFEACARKVDLEWYMMIRYSALLRAPASIDSRVNLKRHRRTML